MYQIQELFSKRPTETIENIFFFDVGSSVGGNPIPESKIDRLVDLTEKIWVEKLHGRYAHEGYGAMIGGCQFDSCPLTLFDEKSKEIAESGKAFLEIACGEPLGLAPSVLTKNPSAHCLITDADPTVIKACQKFVNKNLNDNNIHLAVIDNRAIPLKDETFDYITSFNGINSSSWSGGDSRYRTLKEIYRVLKKGGQLITVENEWADYDKVAEVLKQEGIKYGSEEFEKLFSHGEFFRTYFRDGITMKAFYESIGFRVEDTDKHTLMRYSKLLKEGIYREIGIPIVNLGIKHNIEINMRAQLYIIQKA